MNAKIITGILSIGLGVLGAWFFSTQVNLSRTLTDILIMVTLLGFLIAGNFLIVFGQTKNGKE